jgi:hypothetical protein
VIVGDDDNDDVFVGDVDDVGIEIEEIGVEGGWMVGSNC